MFLLLLKFRLIRNIRFIPRTIGNFFRLKTFMETDPEFLRSIVLQIAEALLDRVGIQFLEHASPLDPASCLLFFIHILCPQTLLICYCSQQHIFYNNFTHNRLYFIIPGLFLQGAISFCLNCVEKWDMI